MSEKLKKYREFLKADDWIKWDDLERDQEKDIPAPPRQKDYPQNAKLIDLPNPQKIKVDNDSLKKLIPKRRSRRRYKDKEISLKKLSFLLWATQGVNEENDNLRNVPSAGARHPFETYLIIRKVKGLENGLYRYIPFEHKLYFIKKIKKTAEVISRVCRNQRFVKRSSLLFVWTVIPYRTEWRYSILSHKVIAMDAGHLCQNLYLAGEALNLGVCAIGAYGQEKTDNILEVDGQEEFAVYGASVGVV